MIHVDNNPSNWNQRVETLQSKYGAEIQHCCYVHLANHDFARDAAQEVFCKLQMQGASRITAERAWLYKCARNHCLDIIKKRSNEARALMRRARLKTMNRQHTSVLSDLVHKEIHKRLHELVFNLPLDLRVPLFLRYIAGFARGEIVEILEMSEHLVKSRLRRALQELRKHSSLRLT